MSQISTTEELYRPHRKHEALFGSEFPSNWLHSDMIQLVAWSQKIVEAKKSKIQGVAFIDDEKEEPPSNPLLKQETHQVYSFSALAPAFLEMFNEEMSHFFAIAKAKNIPVRRPNSMNNYGVVVNQIGMRNMIDTFQQQYLHPLSLVLFPQESTPSFDAHHSFLVRYHADEDLGLDMHTDDSDVTFNVCLGHGEFEGSGLTFCGTMGRPEHRHLSHQYQHEVGQAVMHLGTRRHGADDITKGTRTNLIIWSHNHTWRTGEKYRQGHLMNQSYQKESSPPDAMCLSYTHDRDFQFYKELPPTAEDKTLTPWCPPRGKEYKEFHTKLLQHDPKGDL